MLTCFIKTYLHVHQSVYYSKSYPDCNTNNGGCDQICNQVESSYNCSCKAGYHLYEADGDQGFVLPASESGNKPQDTYHIGHTCVRK